MDGETAPNWAAVVVLVALLGGAVPAAKWYKKILHERLIAKTAKLLSLHSDLDPTEGTYLSNGLKVDGPSIRLRAYFDPEES